MHYIGHKWAMFKIQPGDAGTGTDRVMGISRSTGLLLAAFFLTGTTAAVASEPVINTVELLAYGLMKPSQVAVAKLATEDHPRVDHIRGVRFTRNTQRIIATPETNFGISYRVNTASAGATLDVVHTLIFPEEGIQDQSGHRYERSTEQLTIETGKPVVYGYGFDEDWERVPGEWVFQVWHNDARILQKTFTVLPDESPEREVTQSTD